MAIETGHLLRFAFGRPWRQTEGLLQSIVGLLGFEVGVPDHTTFARRSPSLTLAAALARAQASGGPVPEGLRRWRVAGREARRARPAGVAQTPSGPTSARASTRPQGKGTSAWCGRQPRRRRREPNRPARPARSVVRGPEAARTGLTRPQAVRTAEFDPEADLGAWAARHPRSSTAAPVQRISRQVSGWQEADTSLLSATPRAHKMPVAARGGHQGGRGRRSYETVAAHQILVRVGRKDSGKGERVPRGVKGSGAAAGASSSCTAVVEPMSAPRAGRTEGHAMRATPVTSAQVRKAWTLAARYCSAGRR